ncbi:MAG: hypothetical protein HFF17_15970 [Oscillospiraceae bacterium]|nr:hypothetical protein [Oscillospiraceae bacterium]
MEQAFSPQNKKVFRKVLGFAKGSYDINEKIQCDELDKKRAPGGRVTRNPQSDQDLWSWMSRTGF